MNIPGWLILDVYVLLLAGMLLVFVLRRKQKTRQDHTFLTLLWTVIILLCGDMASRCNPDGASEILYIISRIGSYIIFAGDPFGYLMTLLYIDSWIAHPDQVKRSRIVRVVVIGYVLLNLILVTIGEISGQNLFYSFPNRIYTRGPLYVPRGILNMVFCLVIGTYILSRRREIRTDYTSYVIAFPIIVFFSGMLQVFVGGAAYEYAGTVFACLMLYIYVQNHNMDIDYLTGLLNRKGIDEELQYRIRHCDNLPGFCTYMLDLDFFKNINDDCGHEAGDKALREMADLLKKTFGRHGVVGRYGGDEFLIINEAENLTEAQQYTERLAELCREFNVRNTARRYRLCFSAGYDIYDKDKYPTVDDYMRQLDKNMYNEKISHHAVRGHMEQYKS